MQNRKSAVARNLTCGFGFGTTEFHVLRANDKIIPDLLLHIIRRRNFLDKAQAHFTGVAGQQRVPKEFVEEYEITFPATKEDQINILRKIDKANDEIQAIFCSAETSLNSIALLPSSVSNQFFGNLNVVEVTTDGE